MQIGSAGQIIHGVFYIIDALSQKIIARRFGSGSRAGGFAGIQPGFERGEPLRYHTADVGDFVLERFDFHPDDLRVAVLSQSVLAALFFAQPVFPHSQASRLVVRQRVPINRLGRQMEDASGCFFSVRPFLLAARLVPADIRRLIIAARVI